MKLKQDENSVVNETLASQTSEEEEKIVKTIKNKNDLKKIIESYKREIKPVRVKDREYVGISQEEILKSSISKSSIFIYDDEDGSPKLVNDSYFTYFQGRRIPKTRLYYITPSLALKLLKNHNKKNRNINWKRVEIYQRCMEKGDWWNTHQGGAFYEDGSLSDCQHRLAAVILSDKSIVMPLTFGIEKDAALYIDEGRTRSIKDAAIISDKKGINPKKATTASWMLCGLSKMNRKSSVVTRSEQLEFYEKYKEAIDFACENDGCSKGSPHSQVLGLNLLRAILARIYINISMYNKYNDGEAINRLIQLKKVLTTGCYTDPVADSGALRIANLRISKGGKIEFSGNQQKKGYFKAEYCFNAFMKKEEVNRIGKIKKELYPLVEDDIMILDEIE